MTQEFVVWLGRQAMFTVLLVASPVLALGLLVGIMVSVLQATTQIHEQTLSFIPKIVAIFLAILLCGPWMMRVMLDFATQLFERLPEVVR